MPKIDPAAVAVNAAGIADALRCVQSDSAEDDARFEALTEEYGGWIGVLVQVVEAGEVMERYRVKRGWGAKWGGDLPYVYDVWDAIAETLWVRLGEGPLDELVQSAIEQAVNVEAA
ncbi:MAG: hypothetical protein IPM64_15185 [Phycisphaerales bacterium]|nr:hypothetical protein [Phycisphaerales bacterium]